MRWRQAPKSACSLAAPNCAGCLLGGEPPPLIILHRHDKGAFNFALKMPQSNFLCPAFFGALLPSFFFPVMRFAFRCWAR